MKDEEIWVVGDLTTNSFLQARDGDGVFRSVSLKGADFYDSQEEAQCWLNAVLLEQCFNKTDSESPFQNMKVMKVDIPNEG